MLYRILYPNRGDAMVQSASLVQRSGFRDVSQPTVSVRIFVLVPSTLPMPSMSAVNPLPEAAAQATPVLAYAAPRKSACERRSGRIMGAS
jgi:hypothetical protein